MQSPARLAASRRAAHQAESNLIHKFFRPQSSGDRPTFDWRLPRSQCTVHQCTCKCQRRLCVYSAIVRYPYTYGKYSIFETYRPIRAYFNTFSIGVRARGWGPHPLRLGQTAKAIILGAHAKLFGQKPAVKMKNIISIYYMKKKRNSFRPARRSARNSGFLLITICVG